MLPIPALDDETFRQIVEEARSMIPRLYPQWTDFNYHDPGITFLELFAFLKESQQYHLDQIGPRSRQKYLKLLGMSPRRRTPARVQAILTGTQAFQLPRGARFLAGDVPFETQRAIRLDGGHISFSFFTDGVQRVDFDLAAFTRDDGLRLQPFGRESSVGAQWYLGLDGPLTASLRLWIRVAQDWAVHRNPVSPGSDFSPLADLKWEFLSPQGWQPFTLEQDETRGLLFDGEIVLSGGEDACPWSQVQVGQQQPLGGSGNTRWMRATLTGGAYDVPPVLTGLSVRTVPAIQRETFAECRVLPVENGCVRDDGILGMEGAYQLWLKDGDGAWQTVQSQRQIRNGAAEFTAVFGTARESLLTVWRADFSLARHLAQGDGFPYQRYELAEKGLLYDDFSLLIAAPGGGWELWEKVDALDASGPEDRHYLLDEENGVISFGDCDRGLAPEGEILIVGQAVTLGEQGNVKAGRLERIDGTNPLSVTVWNPDNAQGGQSRESQEDCFLRCRRLLRRTERAVTYADWERLVRQTPGLMIASCKAVPVTQLPRPDGSLDENCVTVVVEPYSLHPQPTLSDGYLRNLQTYLDGRRMLGSRVCVLAPRYVRITVYAELLSQPQYVDARERIEAAVATFFREDRQFGAPVRYSVLYGILDTLDCVAGIEALTIDAQGKGISRGVNGDVLLPHNGLAVLEDAGFKIRPAEQ